MVISRIISIIILVIIIVFVMMNCFHNDTWKVKKQFETLSTSIAKKQGEKLLHTGLKKNKINDLFDSKCTFKTQLYKNSGPFTPMEISNRIFAVRNNFVYLSVNFVDMKIDFPDKNTAITTFTVKATGKRSDGKMENYYREADCVLKLIKDSWLISEIVTVEVLKK